MPKDRTIDYIELPARNLGLAKEFYSSAFGWKFEDYGPEYCAFTDGRLDGGFFKADLHASTEHGSALVILYADDLEQMLARVIEHGGTITREIFSFPGGRRFHFTDPNSNELAIWSDH
jgi:predicted enzyme related to lactoylglutathione lyase